MVPLRILAENPCGYAIQLECGRVTFGFLGGELEFPNLGVFICFCEAAISAIPPRGAAELKLVVGGNEIHMSSIDYECLRNLAGAAQPEAIWWARMESVNAADLGFGRVADSPNIDRGAG